jgi:hypothetical protein
MSAWLEPASENVAHPGMDGGVRLTPPFNCEPASRKRARARLGLHSGRRTAMASLNLALDSVQRLVLRLVAIQSPG